MKRARTILRPLSLLPFALLLGVACVSPGDTESVDEASETVSLDDGAGSFSRAHMMPLPGKQPAFRAAARRQFNFTYHGGPVISHAKVVTIFWGDAVPFMAHLNGFYEGITRSAHLDWLSEYDTPTQSIGRGSFAGSIIDTSPPGDDDLTDRQIQKELVRLIGAGAVPQPDADMLYMLHFPARVSITMDGNRSCQQFCAYHGTFKLNGQNVYYGVMPEVAGGCGACGGTNDKFANSTIIASHELIEAITDPAVGLANTQNDASYLAWYDDLNGEIGDVCESRSAVVDGWSVQLEYSMAAGGCVATRPEAGTSQPGCTHGVCLAGAPLRATCGPCTQKVCNAAPACCTGQWDATCVQRAVAMCGKNCE